MATDTHYTFHYELNRLNKKVLKLSAMVEDRVRQAALAIQNHDEKLIQTLILSDYEVDDMEIEIEEECLKILALHQPVAGDLRFLIAVIKINNELERIADIAVSIGMRVQTIAKTHDGAFYFDYKEMSEKVVTMLKMSIDALIDRDAAMARRIFVIDDEIDALRSKAYKTIKEVLERHSGDPAGLINTYLLARHLERIGDRATNIAEEVIYLVEGAIVRGN